MAFPKTSGVTSLKYLLAVAASICAFSVPAMASEEFYGRIETRPVGNAGIWIISGQQVEVTDKTEIDSDNGPLVVGTCVEVEHKKGVVSEIESAKPAKCGKL
ncbi:hypothetical protein A7981_00490 [Methylovorus sp. MM2]|uniref:DUF5666 domain-containing protein n=1 Tax=Methylovorus sp. MM2 TaxID=1848038 RepID=UPI0007E241D4|nr:DUF5666 domain-containing protein [Methylovorus sp. MM2]OAM52007.1 hypothetical protein A7981_00490 [Methylovorus sp. MM2]